ncbi:MAG: hypothetical protein ACKO9Z_08590 [Planctomycetota bacterium]
MRFHTILARCLPLVPALLLPSCRSGGKDKLESTIRQREQRIIQLQEDIDKLAGYNMALQTEVRIMRGQPLPSSCDPFTPLYPVRSVVVGRSTTPIDDDRLPGDEGVQVVLEPRDADGKLQRAPACASVTIVEVDGQGLKSPIGTWDYSPEQMRASWKQGLLTSGFVLNCLWQAPPKSDRVKIMASFTMEDGRRFEAEKELAIKPPVDRSGAFPGSGSALPAPGASTPGVLELPVPQQPVPLPLPRMNPVPGPAPVEPAKPTGPTGLPNAVPPAPPAAVLLDPRVS